jgi:DNA polymerase-3 subunit delta
MIKNLILLTGEDDFRLRERLNFYKKAFKSKYLDGEIEYFEKENKLLELENAVFTQNLFGGRRLILLEKFWDSDKFEQAEKSDFFKKITEFVASCTLIVVEPKLDKRLKISKFLLENAKTEKFDLMNEVQILHWIENYVHKQEGKISKANAQILLKRCGVNLWNLSSEIKKLISAGEEEITEKLIHQLTLPHPSVIMWDFLESLSKKNIHNALKRFNEMMQGGVTVHEILPMIFREVRLHAQIRNGIEHNLDAKKIAIEMKSHPYPIQKTYPLTKHFSSKKIESMYDELFEIDQKIKTGKIVISTDDTSELELAIEKFIIKVCN